MKWVEFIKQIIVGWSNPNQYLYLFNSVVFRNVKYYKQKRVENIGEHYENDVVTQNTYKFTLRY